MSSRRQVSPNQTVLWTIYELIDMQAARLSWHPESTSHWWAVGDSAIGRAVVLTTWRAVQEAWRAVRIAVRSLHPQPRLRAAGSGL
jgi:hypothetical protein